MKTLFVLTLLLSTVQALAMMRPDPSIPERSGKLSPKPVPSAHEILKNRMEQSRLFLEILLELKAAPEWLVVPQEVEKLAQDRYELLYNKKFIPETDRSAFREIHQLDRVGIAAEYYESLKHELNVFELTEAKCGLTLSSIQ